MDNLKGLKMSADASPAPAKTGGSWLSSATDLLKFGVTTWSDEQQRQAEQDTAAAALKLEQLRIAQLQQEQKLAETTSTGVVSKIKAYALPLAITGGLVVIGISAYFFFKNKK
jgi:uncharacterized membrane-anchored protein